MKTFEPFKIASTGLEPGVTLIEASAGTGKTFAIAGIVLRLVLELRIPIEQIAAVTYTVAATEELRDRVRKRLRNALDGLRIGSSEDDIVAGYLNSGGNVGQGVRDIDFAVQNFDEARIFTIHGFCQRVLHEYAFESGMLFDMELLTDPTPVFEEVAQDFWRKQFYGGPALVSRLAISHGRSPADWIGLLQQTVSHPDLVILPRPEVAQAAAISMQIEKKFEQLAAQWNANHNSILRLLRHDRNLSRDKCESNFGPENLRLIEAELAAVCTDFRRANPNSLAAIKKVSRSEVQRCTKSAGVSPRHDFFDLCEDFCNFTSAYFHQLDHEFIAFARREIPRRKARLKVLTFDDLLTRLRDALESPGGEILAKALGAQYRAALIDEFQDTDPIQYDIFRRIFAGGGHYLFLIGDPKQAIYGFRGADVFTYLRAAGEASMGYTLNTNFRSEKRLLDAINALFSNIERPFLIEGIDYRPVSPAQKSRENFTELIETTSDGPLRFRWLESCGKPLKQTDAESQTNYAVAADIARLKASGARLGNRRLKFGDMAVLVRSNAQAASLQDVLRAKGVKSVLKTEESVFKTREACETLRLLEAVLEPRRDILLRTALATGLFGLNAADIVAFDSAEDKWQAWLDKFLDYRSKWENACFIALFRHLLVDQNVRERLVRCPAGERVLTNFLHIAELLHRAESEEGLAPDALCAWLRQRINDFANSPDEDQLRLESDDDAVLLATVHKSKGLEYPIVFCPFLWKAADPKNRGGILFHDPANGYRLTLDLQDKRPEPDDNKNMARTECVAESLRALYVALTRAQNRCYVYAGDISGFEWSPLARVFGSASPFRALQALAKNAGGSVTVTVVDPAEDQKVKVQASETELTGLSARSFSGAIPRARMIASFTSLVSGALEEERDRNVVELGQPSLETEATINDLSRFEGGIRGGVFLHDVLEHLDFQAPNQIDQLVGLKLATHGIAGSDWREPFCAQLRLLLATPLQPGLTLSQIPLAQRLSEVEFSFPIVSLQPDQLRKFFLKHGGPPLPREFPDSLGRLCFQPVEGFMRGFIDLLFRFGERYYIVDWKSNWLGNRPGDYDEQAIRACMAQHAYFLQYHLYTIAADLYLSSRIAGYEYDKQFGGVFYVFFRGLDPENPNCGIFRDRPHAFLVRALRQNLIDGLL